MASAPVLACSVLRACLILAESKSKCLCFSWLLRSSKHALCHEYVGDVHFVKFYVHCLGAWGETRPALTASVYVTLSRVCMPNAVENSRFSRAAVVTPVLSAIQK